MINRMHKAKHNKQIQLEKYKKLTCIKVKWSSVRDGRYTIRICSEKSPVLVNNTSCI